MAKLTLGKDWTIYLVTNDPNNFDSLVFFHNIDTVPGQRVLRFSADQIQTDVIVVGNRRGVLSLKAQCYHWGADGSKEEPTEVALALCKAVESGDKVAALALADWVKESWDREQYNDYGDELPQAPELPKL